MAPFPSSCFVFLFALLASLSTSPVGAKTNGLGFDVDMIHRDSPRSPYYDPSIPRFERVRRAIRRSFARHESLTSFATHNRASSFRKSFTTGIVGDSGEYLMKIYLGTQTYPIWAIADTGSTLTWTQCFPCEACYEQNAVPYNPVLSGTYELASCTDPLCRGAGTVSCGYGSRCNYLYSYGDGSFTAGNLATDKVSFLSGNGYTSFSGVYIGCGYANGGLFSAQGSGLVGLGNSPISIVNQFNVSRFSYCLPDSAGKVVSKIKFGSKAAIKGKGLVSTPLITTSSDDNPFYYLTILGFKVGSTEIISSQARKKGNTIIDSGTTLTLLPSDLVYGVASALANDISCSRNRTAEQEVGLALCYNVKSAGCDFSLPPVIVHFDGGDLNLSETNTFIEVEDGVKCLSLAGVPASTPAIWGNIAQTYIQTEYDLGNRKLKFLPPDSSNP